MDERVIQFRIGVMVLASIIIAAILVVMFGEGPRFLKPTYTVKIKVSDAPGVTPKTPIRKAGILIGRVTTVELDEEAGGAIITAEIDADRRLGANEICRISPSLLGDSQLNFVLPEGRPRSDESLQDGDVVAGAVSKDPVQVISDLQMSMSEAIGSVSRTSEDLRQVIHQIGGLLEGNEDRINSIVAKADTSLDIIQEAVTNVNDVISDPELRVRLKEALAEAPELFRQTKDTLHRMNGTIALVDKNLKNMEGFTEPLGERGKSIMDEVDRAADKLDRLMGELLVFSESLNRGEGSLAQLIHNPDLYQNLNRAASNIEAMSEELRPIIWNARVFSDKIARHPEILGVRGALQRNAGTKGVPTFSTQNRPALWTDEWRVE